MTGGDALVRTAVGAGVDVCFANPGTTEMDLVASLDRVAGMRAVLGLFEGVCTGAADGYARMTGRPAMTLLHLGPGFANGIANLHNARRARTPVLNVIGDHATWHVDADAPLTSDIVSLASPVSGFVRTTARAADLGRDTADAILAAQTAPGCVSTMIVPADCAWEDEGAAVAAHSVPDRPAVDDALLDETWALIGSGDAILLLGGAALTDENALRAAARIQAGTGTRVMNAIFPARTERGRGLPAFPTVPYFPEQGIQALEGVSTLVLAGATEPVAFFGYRGTPSRLTPKGTTLHTLATPADDVCSALVALADRVKGGAPATPSAPAPEVGTGPLNGEVLGNTIAALQPENAIVVDEGATSSLVYTLASSSAPRHSMLSLTGGAIGQGIPCAVGAAVACPDRQVISLQADGSGMYTLQGLWTQAREGLNVLTIVCANRNYLILKFELARAGIAEPGPQAQALTSLENPQIDWVSMARGVGVPAEQATTGEDLTAAIGRGLATDGPYLIEAVLG